MGLIAPEPPPYDPMEWRTLPLDERGRMVCQAWAHAGLRHAGGDLSGLRPEGRRSTSARGSSSAASPRASARCATSARGGSRRSRFRRPSCGACSSRCWASAAGAARSPAATSRRSAACCTSCGPAPPSCRSSRSCRSSAAPADAGSTSLAVRGAGRRAGLRAVVSPTLDPSVARRRWPCWCRCSASSTRRSFSPRAPSTTG